MVNVKKRWQIWIPLAIGLLDLAWAYSALNVPQGSNAASSVSMINATVWIFLHVPAALLNSMFFEKGPQMTQAELILLGALGALQMAALGFWLGKYLEKKRKA
jgi:hypothetical protein